MAKKVFRNADVRDMRLIPDEVKLRFLEMDTTVVVAASGKCSEGSFELIQWTSKPVASDFNIFMQRVKTGQHVRFSAGNVTFEYLPPARIFIGEMRLHFAGERVFISMVDQLSRFPCITTPLSEERLNETNVTHVEAVPWKNNQGVPGILTSLGINKQLFFWTFEDFKASLTPYHRNLLSTLTLERSAVFTLGVKFPVRFEFSQSYGIFFGTYHCCGKIFSVSLVPEVIRFAFIKMIDLADRYQSTPVEGSGFSDAVLCERGGSAANLIIIPFTDGANAIRQLQALASREPSATKRKAEEAEELTDSDKEAVKESGQDTGKESEKRVRETKDLSKEVKESGKDSSKEPSKEPATSGSFKEPPAKRKPEEKRKEGK